MRLSSLAAMVFIVLAAGCAGPSLPRSKPVVVAATVLSPAPEKIPESTKVLPPRDHCRAADLQYLIGQPRTEIPVPVDMTLQRVLCATCTPGSDINSRRLNFYVDMETGRIVKIACG